jgi:hypothetical protein
MLGGIPGPEATSSKVLEKSTVSRSEAKRNGLGKQLTQEIGHGHRSLDSDVTNTKVRYPTGYARRECLVDDIIRTRPGSREYEATRGSKRRAKKKRAW